MVASPMSAQIARKVISVFHHNQNLANIESQYELSNREKEVLSALAEGNNYQEIA